MKRLDGRGCQIVPPKSASKVLCEIWKHIDRPMVELADAMGLSRVAMYHWKTGRSQPQIMSIEELCDILGLEIIVRKKSESLPINKPSALPLALNLSGLPSSPTPES